MRQEVHNNFAMLHGEIDIQEAKTYELGFLPAGCVISHIETNVPYPEDTNDIPNGTTLKLLLGSEDLAIGSTYEPKTMRFRGFMGFCSLTSNAMPKKIEQKITLVLDKALLSVGKFRYSIVYALPSKQMVEA